MECMEREKTKPRNGDTVTVTNGKKLVVDWVEADIVVHTKEGQTIPLEWLRLNPNNPTDWFCDSGG